MKYVGVDIGGTNLKAGLVDESGTLLATQKMKVASIVDREGLAWTVASLVQELAKAANIPVSDVASVGVGVPGTVDIRAGSIAYTCNLPLRDVPLRKLFHKYLNIPLYIENDANCAALAEFHVGAGRESKRFVTITLGTGVGAGIIHNGKIYHGANGMAGEVHGCWEQYASATALKRMTAEALAAYPDSILARVITENDGHVSGQSAFIAAREGDPVGQLVCDRYVDYLACGVVNVVNIFQPDTLAIGGGVSNEADEQLLLPVQQRVARESIPCGKDRRTRIVKAQLGNRAGLIGAALLGKNKRI